MSPEPEPNQESEIGKSPESKILHGKGSGWKPGGFSSPSYPKPKYTPTPETEVLTEASDGLLAANEEGSQKQ